MNLKIEWQKKFRAEHPWYRLLEFAKRRCSDPKYKNFNRYGGRGIKCTLTVEQVKLLWERDGGERMLRASLDRRDSDLDYCFDNCRIMEFAENSANKCNDEPGSCSDPEWSE